MHLVYRIWLPFVNTSYPMLSLRLAYSGPAKPVPAASRGQAQTGCQNVTFVVE
jgi:hypothetical protein